MSLCVKKTGVHNRFPLAFLWCAAVALALGLLANRGHAATGGWVPNATGDWDGVDNIGVYGTIDGNGTAIYNNSPTNAYGPANGYAGAGAGESGYWLNSPHGYTTNGTDPATGYAQDYTSCSGLQLGYYSVAPFSGTAKGPGTFIVQGGTFTVNGPIQLSEVHIGIPGQSEAGTLTVQGGDLICSAITVGDLTNTSAAALTVSGGTLNLSGGAVQPGAAGFTNSTFTFSGGAIQNASSATLTSFGGSTCTGGVSGLTGPLTLNLSSPGTFTGSVTGSSPGSVVNTSARA